MDGGAEAIGKWSFLGSGCSGGRWQQSGHFEGVDVKAGEVGEGEGDSDESDEEEDEDEYEDTGDEDLELFHFYDCIGRKEIFREKRKLLEHIRTCDNL